MKLINLEYFYGNRQLTIVRVSLRRYRRKPNIELSLTDLITICMSNNLKYMYVVLHLLSVSLNPQQNSSNTNKFRSPRSVQFRNIESTSLFILLPERQSQNNSNPECESNS